MTWRVKVVALLVVACVIAGGLVVSAGPLNPPLGHVAPTYKTLGEVEPRIAISAANTPGDANSVFRVSQPGSYYLTDRVRGEAGKHGIEVEADCCVTIDLMGFRVEGVPESLNGININAGTQHSVRNGQVLLWGGDGVNTIGAGNIRLDGLELSFNQGDGVRGGAGPHRMTDCTAEVNGGAGFRAGIDSIVERCIAIGNIGTGIEIANGRVVGCIAHENRSDGIAVTFNSATISDNLCYGNGLLSGDGSGIHIPGHSVRVESNTCYGNSWGIRIEGFHNVIVRNVCGYNGVDWYLGSANIYGPVIDRRSGSSSAVSGFSAPDTLGSDHPNANFSH